MNNVSRPADRRGAMFRPGAMSTLTWTCSVTVLTALLVGAAPPSARGESLFSGAIAAVQPKMVKIHGAGGLAGLEPYQSGFLISAEGHVLTVWSYVLDTDYLTVTLNDGRKFEGKLVGANPQLELAVLKIDAGQQPLPYFNLAGSASADIGTRVLAFSNLFDVAVGEEAASVQHGVIAARSRLDARRGTFETPYHGPVYVTDAITNNPGAAGGALTNLRGELLGMLGKELRNALNHTWLNYAIPSDQMTSAIDEIIAGKVRAAAERDKPAPAGGGIDLARWGIALVPDVLDRTPPFVDEVVPGSPAAQAGVKTDDLVLFVGEHLVQSCRALRDELARLQPTENVKLVLMRSQDLLEVVLKPSAALPPDGPINGPADAPRPEK
jgi:S1-C subfamily serine protease